MYYVLLNIVYYLKLNYIRPIYFSVIKYFSVITDILCIINYFHTHLVSNNLNKLR